MKLCHYGCGAFGTHTFKNGKVCCARRVNLCPAQIEKKKLTCRTVDPVTGLTPMQQRDLTLRNTIDPDTGLSLYQLKVNKIQSSNRRVNPETGMTNLQLSHRKLAEKDPLTGESKKSQQAKAVVEKMKKEIDPESGLTKWQESRIKSKESHKKRTTEQRDISKQKRSVSLDQINPETNLTRRVEMGLKTSKRLTTVDPETGLTPAKKRAQKNMQNAKWLNSVTRGKASKESLRLFDPLIEYCERLGIEWCCGTRNRSEWWIKDQLGKVRFYDFVLLDLKFIVEYHGETWHPSANKLTEQQWKSWKAPGSSLTAQEQNQIDLDKVQLALDQGFEIAVVWSSDNIDQSIADLKEIIHWKYQNIKMSTES
jgi:hypothetical protein